MRSSAGRLIALTDFEELSMEVWREGNSELGLFGFKLFNLDGRKHVSDWFTHFHRSLIISCLPEETHFLSSIVSLERVVQHPQVIRLWSKFYFPSECASRQELPSCGFFSFLHHLWSGGSIFAICLWEFISSSASPLIIWGWLSILDFLIGLGLENRGCIWGKARNEILARDLQSIYKYYLLFMRLFSWLVSTSWCLPGCI